MKFFIDTANLEQIQEAYDLGLTALYHVATQSPKSPLIIRLPLFLSRM